MTSQLPEQREIELVEKVELRLALADTPLKLEKCLDMFLAPLLLKLASPYASVRQAVFNSLKDILSRLNTFNDIKLPLEKLIQQAQSPPESVDGNDSNVRLYSLLMASKGIDRIDRVETSLLSSVIQGISKLPRNAGARMFHILCKMLKKWKQPEKGSKSEEDIQSRLKVNDKSDISFLTSRFTKFLLLSPARPDPQAGVIPRGYSCPGLSVADVSFFTYDAGVSFTKEQMIQFKKAVFNFVTSGLPLQDYAKTVFLLVASSDQGDLLEIASQELKRLAIPYEDETFIDSIITLYGGDKKTGCPPTRHELQEKILNILNRSLVATSKRLNVAIICSIGMNSKHYKMRSLCLKFIRHVAKNNISNLVSVREDGDDGVLETSIASLILHNLHSEGWPMLQLGSTTLNFNSSISQRRSQYETLGEILKRDGSLLEDLSYIEFLLDSLKGDVSEVHTSIQECLTSLTVKIPMLPESSKTKLRKLIRTCLADDYEIECAESKDKKDALMSCRMVCIKYANAAFPFNDPEARMFNIWGTARINRFDIIEESFKGLHPYWFKVNQIANTKEFRSSKEKLTAENKEVQFASTELYINLLLSEMQDKVKLPQASIWKTLGTAVRFSKQCLISESIYGKNTMVVQDEDWSIRIENSLVVDEKVHETVRDKIACFEKGLISKYLKFLCNEFTMKDQHNHQVCLSLYSDRIFGEVLLTLLRLCDDDALRSLESITPSLFNYLRSTETSQDTDIEIAANALGIVSACKRTLEDASDTMTKPKGNDSTVTEQASIIANSYILPRLYLRNNVDRAAGIDSAILLRKLTALLSASQNRKLINQLISQVCKSDMLERMGDQTSSNDFIVKITEVLQSSLINDTAATETWAYLSIHAASTAHFKHFFDKLFESHVSKQIDYLFSAGEAISVIAGGWESKFLHRQLDVRNVSFAKLKENFSRDRISYVLDQLLVSCDSTKPSLRKAACVWLLSLTQYLGHSEEISSRCNHIHIRFMRFLGDRDEFVQESAARGLALIYEIGNADLKEDMVKGLLRSFTDSAKGVNMSAGSVGADTELFDDNTLKTDEGSVRTYKDILNLASEVGDPALVYKFMSLAKSSSLWSSKKGIAFGLGAIVSKSSLQNLILTDEVTASRLIPKLFRYKFDPYPNVARSMNDIWQTLIQDTNATLNFFLKEILEELLRGMSNKEWRVREASALALLYLMQTQQEEKLASHFLEIWTMAFRVVDDIKESVRVAGTKLTNVLAKALISSIDPAKGTNSDKSELILDHILPFFLGTKGLNSDAEEVRKFALTTVINLVKNSGDTIKPYAVQLVFEFTLLFSSIEPQVINYLSLNATKYNIDSNTIDIHRQNGVTTSPLFDAIDLLIKRSDDSMVEQHVNSAIKATKKAVGLPSKIAASAVLGLLVRRYSVLLTPFCGKLLKACTNSFESRSESVSLSFAKCFGLLFRIATVEKAGKYAAILCQMYFDSGENAQKKVVAAAIDAVLKQAPSQFENISSLFIPLLFIASNDVDKAVGSNFEQVWREASKSGSASVRLYLAEIIELLQKNISSADFSTRKTCSKTIVLLCENADRTIKPQQIQKMFEITMNSLVGRSWEGKDSLLRALQSLVAKFTKFVEGNSSLKESISVLFVTEISRKNVPYVKNALVPYCEFVTFFPAINLIEKLIAIAEFIFKGDTDVSELENSESINSSKRMKHDSDISKKSSKKNVEWEEYITNILKLCAKIFKSSTSPEACSFELLKFIIRRFSRLFKNTGTHYTWRSQVAICEVGNVVLESPYYLLNSRDFAEFIKELWGMAFEYNSTNESIENVKVQTVRLGAHIITKMPNLKNGIQSDLKNLSEMALTSKVEVELKNVNII